MRKLFEQDGKRGDMIQKGLSLFAARGYDAVSVRDIAKAAGVSEAALYKHFKGKEDMALYIFTTIIKEYTQQIEVIDERTQGAVEKLCAIVNLTYNFYDEYPEAIRFTLLSQYSFWDSVSEEVKPHFVYRRILEEGMAKGEIPKQEVYFWITIFSGVMLQPLAQYPYFYDVLPEFDQLKEKVIQLVRKLFQ